MKKVLLTILAFIYLANISGATLQLHYCMGKLVRVGLIPEKQSQCSHCGMDKALKQAKDCCKDEQKKVSSEKDQKAIIAAYKSIKNTAAETPVLYSAFKPVFHPSAAVNFPVSHAPPASVPLHILYCSYLI